MLEQSNLVNVALISASQEREETVLSYRWGVRVSGGMHGRDMHREGVLCKLFNHTPTRVI